MESERPDLLALRARLDAAEEVYAKVLAAVDALAGFELPAERLPELPAQLTRLNELWRTPPRPDASGLGGALRARAWDAVAPALARQQEFDATLVQLLNGQIEETARLNVRLRELAAALVHYLQAVQPLMDVRDRMATALATTRSELILEAFDRRQESLARRIEGLLALRDRLAAVSEEVRALRATLASAPPPELATAADAAAEDSAYVAFESRFRGDAEELRERLRGYVASFHGLAPVADLGCGRGEFLGLLREAGIEARGVESNLRSVGECRGRGLEVSHGDLVAFLRQCPDASLGGVFAAQVAEHLPPAALQALLREAHRALRPTGLLLIETVNPRSVFGFLEVYLRDLTHERPLHPDTLSFLAAAAGFCEVRVELRSPVSASERLQPIPGDGLPERTAAVLNENLDRLNGFLFGPREYALFARR